MMDDYGIASGLPGGAICYCVTIIMPPAPPAQVDFTVAANIGSIEYAYLGTFDNAFEISGRGLEGADGWLEAGLYLTGVYGGLILLDDDGRLSPLFPREILNTGTIRGDDYSIFSDSTIDTLIRNEGVLIGDVGLGDGREQLINTGRILGAVEAGEFDPLGFRDGDIVENHGVIRHSVTFGRGNDLFTSFGDARVGTKEALAPVKGMGGNDRLTGAAADDAFHGGAGRDKLIGGGGNDRLFGNYDNDILRGGAGDDLIVGGFGRDFMAGGAGRDIFRFSQAGHSGVGRQADKIRDFRNGDDLIDVSILGNDLAFIEDAAFSGEGRGEMRFVAGGPPGGKIFVDVDGDGLRDMRIDVLGAVSLSQSDFIF